MNSLEKLVGCMEIERTIKGERPDLADKLKIKECHGKPYLYFPEEEK